MKALKVFESAFLLTLLWLCFAVCCFVAPLMALIYPFARKGRYVRNLAEAADRFLAAMFGFSGRWTLSVECAFSRSPYFQILHALLNIIVPEHCEKAAFKEGAYCRMRDKRLGTK